MESDDEELARAAMAGDQRAFETLFARYYPPLLRYLEHLSASRYQAEDLVQDVFVRFLRQRSYRADRPFRPWLYAVATNAVRDQLRSTHRIPPSEPINADRRSADPDPFEVVSGRLVAGDVSRLLRRLEPEYRQTIALRIAGDLSLTQIAELQGVPVGTVKSRLSMGLRRLRQWLAAQQFEEQA